MDYSTEVKGLELPMHDPRAYHGIGLAYAMSNRGGCHLQHMEHFVEIGLAVYPEIGLTGGYDRLESDGKAEITVPCEDLGMVVGAATICVFVMTCITLNDLIGMMRVTTGFDYDVKEIMECGERLWHLKRAINNSMGIRACDDRLPSKVMIPFRDGSTKGSAPDMKSMLNKYYQLRCLDENGIPHKGKMESLGLLKLFPKLYC
jgi:aldehyde:ferredoxin oxidoreductase